MINRYQFEDLISEYIDGNISKKNKIEIEEWISQNPEDGELFKGIKENIVAMNNLNKATVSKDFNERLNKRIAKNIKKEMKIRKLMFGFNRLNFIAFMGTSFSFIILIAVFLSFNFKDNHNEAFVEKKDKTIKIIDNNTNNAKYADSYKDSLDYKNNNKKIKKHSGNVKLVGN